MMYCGLDPSAGRLNAHALIYRVRAPLWSSKEGFMELDQRACAHILPGT